MVENNEIGFLEENVRALCRIGQSTKTKRAGFIGEKGIGFKSVFTVTDRPEVHSNGFHFCFDRTNSQQILGYVVPEWIESESPRTPHTTLILPAKPGASFTTEKLGELTEDVLLFLRKLRAIQICNETAGRTRSYRKREVDGLVTLAVSEVTDGGADSTTVERRYRTVRHIYSTATLAEQKREGVQEAEIVLAFPIDENGVAEAGDTKSVFAFLPVRDFGFRFSFRPTSCSAQIVKIFTRQVPGMCAPEKRSHRRSFGQCRCSARIPCLLAHSCSTSRDPRKWPNPFFAEVGNGIVKALKGTPCILVESGAWRVPAEVLTADDDFARLFVNEDLQRVLGVEYLSKQVDAPKAVLDRLGSRPG